VCCLGASLPSATAAEPPAPRSKLFYANLWVQVLAAIALALLLGHFSPAKAVAMKPLGELKAARWMAVSV
jgi:aerobic C4-dicarboxylate transport protein